MTARDLPAEETVRFLETILPAGSRVLDVGCGEGEVAARLKERGFTVRAIDTDTAAVEAARSRGVGALQCDFLCYDDAPVDAIVFTRSLHHIQPVADAVARAERLLAAGGLLVAEEFAREAADRPTARWFYDLVALLEAANCLAPSERLSSRHSDPLERWNEDHLLEPLNTGEEMRQALASRFSIEREEQTSYLYRHFCGRLPERSAGLTLASLLLEMEKRGISEGVLRPTGLRIVARRGGVER